MTAQQSASASDPPADPQSPEEALIERLIGEFQLSTAEQLRLHELQAALARHGVAPTDPAFCRWLSPVFCSSPAEQAQFLARFQELRAEVAPASPPVWRRVAPPRRPGQTAAVASRPPPALEIDEVRRRSRRDALVLGLLGAGLLVALGLLMLLLGGQEVPLPGTAPPPPDVPEARDTLTQIQRMAAGWGLKLNLGPWALLGLIPLLLGLALSALLVWRLRREQRAFRPTPEASRPIALRAALGDYFGSQDVLRSMLNLARHGRAPGSRLHIRRSLRATVRNAGYPTLRFGARPKIPGYLLLVDRESPRDHLPLVAEILARRLRQQYAAVTRYGFNRRPRLLVNLDDPGERLASLSELAASLSDACMLVLAETDRLVRPDGRPVDWLDDLADAGHVTVLDPRAESDWAGDEAALRRAGLAVLPATPDGVRRYAEWLAVGSGAPAGVPPQPPRLDLPFQLSRHRAMLLSAEPLDEDLLEGLLADLEDWLGEDLMRLMRALAVFPRLEPPLTLALGKALKAADGKTPLLTDDTLLQVVRLPWLRAGRMPDQLRERLARGLSRKDLRTTVRMVHAFLVSETDALRHLASRPPRRPDLLVHWLRQSEDSDLHDPLLIDAVEGRAAEKLGTPADPTLSERLRRAGRNPSLVSAAVAGIAASVTMWAQPLYEERPVPDVAATQNEQADALDAQADALEAQAALDAAADAAAAPAKAVSASLEPQPSAPAPSIPVRVSPSKDPRPNFQMAQIQGNAALERLFRLQESEGTVYQSAIDELRSAMAGGDLAAIRRVDAATQNQLDAYEAENRDRPQQQQQQQQQQQAPPTTSRTFIVFFPFDQYVLTPEGQSVVLGAAAFVRDSDVVSVNVVGHHDTSDGRQDALRLSERRARAVADALVGSGVSGELISVDWKGEAEPPVPTGNNVKEPLNRRAEISIIYRSPRVTAK